MSTITREWLQQKIAAMEATRDEIPFGLDEDDSNTLAAMRIALASLEAEAVAWLLSGGGAKNHVSFDSGNAYADPLREVTPLYTAPPAPVSVPDVMAGKSFEYIANTFQVSISEAQWILVGWNSCRAAMLQGADRPQNAPQNIPENIPSTQFKPVADLYEVTVPGGRSTTFTKDAAEASDCRVMGWHVQEYIKLERYQVAILQSFGNSEQLNSLVIPDGYVLVPVEPTAEMISSGIAAHYERSQIQIHDRPAPGPMECAYVAMLAAAPQQE
ncbi:hypothetical protein V1605_16715 [Enterobacter soli]|uniref:hypothetical protein n=1 Tax=Enterobacter soli TaxID=885040 RepID=UPI003754BD59